MGFTGKDYRRAIIALVVVIFVGFVIDQVMAGNMMWAGIVTGLFCILCVIAIVWFLFGSVWGSRSNW